MRRFLYTCAAAALSAITLACAAGAQDNASSGPARRADPGAQIAAQIVTVDRQRLFAETKYGRRVQDTVEQERVRLAAETRKAEELLLQEERSLTEQKATLTPDAFRDLARAFDEKVQALRNEGSAREQMFVRRFDKEQAAFFEQIGPVLGQLVRELGAVMIIDRRAVLLAAQNIDITNVAIARIDDVLGDGAPVTNGSIDTPTGPTLATPDPADPADGLSAN